MRQKRTLHLLVSRTSSELKGYLETSNEVISGVFISSHFKACLFRVGEERERYTLSESKPKVR